MRKDNIFKDDYNLHFNNVILNYMKKIQITLKRNITINLCFRSCPEDFYVAFIKCACAGQHLESRKHCTDLMLMSCLAFISRISSDLGKCFII